MRSYFSDTSIEPAEVVQASGSGRLPGGSTVEEGQTRSVLWIPQQCLLDYQKAVKSAKKDSFLIL